MFVQVFEVLLSAQSMVFLFLVPALPQHFPREVLLVQLRGHWRLKRASMRADNLETNACPVLHPFSHVSLTCAGVCLFMCAGSGSVRNHIDVFEFLVSLSL